MIPVLSAFLGLVLLAACAEFLRHARWLECLALIALLTLGVVTRPDLGHHRTVVANSIMSAGAHSMMLGNTDRATVAVKTTSRLEYRDLFLLSFTTFEGAAASVGLFGRVFVFGGLAGNR